VLVAGKESALSEEVLWGTEKKRKQGKAGAKDSIALPDYHMAVITHPMG